MDIEGAEKKALKGASSIFKNAQNLHFSICTYHFEDDAKEIADFLNKHNREYYFSKGYLNLEWGLRRGIIRNC
jgi:16S rRNA C967 or C1407 C5-methylase (RsmB/RsmF family)